MHLCRSHYLFPTPIFFVDKGLPVIPFAQPAIFSLDKIPEDQDGGKRKTRPGNKAQRPNLILEEETDTASVMINFYSKKYLN